MSTGRLNKLAGQIGEYLVCAELGRRGLIATPFAGNVPTFDVLATDESCRTVPIQEGESQRQLAKYGDTMDANRDRPCCRKAELLWTNKARYAGFDLGVRGNRWPRQSRSFLRVDRS
jgi:hypothetical protein